MRSLIVGLFLFAHFLFAQPQPTPPPVDSMMHWRDATIALGKVVTTGNEKKFVVSGTAVVVAADDERACLLTAKHMVQNPETGANEQTLWMRMTSEKGEEEEPVPLTLFNKQGNQVWVGLPNNDLAVIPVPFDKIKVRPIHAVPLRDFAQSGDDVYQGAQVLVLGYPQFFRRPDETDPYSTSPIARSGIVAWTDPGDPVDRPFLVDSNLYGGNSGGPVFKVRQGFDRSGNFNVGNVGYTFIGIVSKGPRTAVGIQVGNDNVVRRNQITGQNEPYYANVPYVGGIAIIEPAAKARELITEVLHLPVAK